MKSILITGGTSGLGLALCRLFHHQGWQVITCGRRPLVDKTLEYHYHPCDVSKPEEVRELVDYCAKTFGHLDTVINNAGIAGSNSLNLGDSDKLWHEIINTNLNGVYYICKYALPLVPQNSGTIINIASILGIKGVFDQTAYTAAKHGVIGFTKALALYLAPKKITVNALCPGWIDTPMAEKRKIELKTDWETLLRHVPLGLKLRGEEVAAMAEYLCSPLARNITGQALVIDGGASL